MQVKFAEPGDQDVQDLATGLQQFAPGTLHSHGDPQVYHFVCQALGCWFS